MDSEKKFIPLTEENLKEQTGWTMEEAEEAARESEKEEVILFYAEKFGWWLDEDKKKEALEMGDEEWAEEMVRQISSGGHELGYRLRLAKGFLEYLNVDKDDFVKRIQKKIVSKEISIRPEDVEIPIQEAFDGVTEQDEKDFLEKIAMNVPKIWEEAESIVPQKNPKEQVELHKYTKEAEEALKGMGWNGKDAISYNSREEE